MFVILVPKGDYERERYVLDTVESDPLINTVNSDQIILFANPIPRS